MRARVVLSLALSLLSARAGAQSTPRAGKKEPPAETPATSQAPETTVEAQPAVAPSKPVATQAPAPAAPAPPEALAGFSDGTAFLRSPDNLFQLFPSGRVQVDSFFYKSNDKTPNKTFAVRRARLEATGWVGPMVFFSIAGDFALGPPAAANPAAPTNVMTTDDFVGIAPWQNLAILQVGQFDAPFTLENRTSDK